MYVNIIKSFIMLNNKYLQEIFFKSKLKKKKYFNNRAVRPLPIKSNRIKRSKEKIYFISSEYIHNWSLQLLITSFSHHLCCVR